MSARVLVVDDLAANVKLLEARLTAEYFDVATAASGAEALAWLAGETPDLVLLDVMMPGMDGFEVCRRIKADPATTHVPVVMVSALSDTSDRVQGLEAGADDFLTKPVADAALIARVKALTRLKMAMDELRARLGAGSGPSAPPPVLPDLPGTGAAVLLVADQPVQARRLAEALDRDGHVLTEAATPDAALAAGTGFDLILIDLDLADEDPLRLCSKLRANEATRQVPVVLIVDEGDDARLARGLDMGVNDFLVKPLDRNELRARVRSQVRYRRYQQRLRADSQRVMSMAWTDSLTGLYNRAYLADYLPRRLRETQEEGKPLAVLMVDVDHFKAVNDTWGHPVGDRVLGAVARRLQDNVRGFDLVARMGGEEFVLIMPHCRHRDMPMVARRLLEAVAAEPVRDGDQAIPVSVSMGIALARPDDGPDDLLRRADDNLLAAKRGGRNRAVIDDRLEPVTGG